MKRILSILLLCSFPSFSQVIPATKVQSDTVEITRIITPVRFLKKGESVYQSGHAVISIRKECSKILFYVTSTKQVLYPSKIAAIDKEK